MKSFRPVQALIIGVIFWKTDADVTVETAISVANKVSFECGNSENLICTINPFGGTMTWQIGNIPAASCTTSVCTTNNKFSGDYTFTFNVTTGVFHLTISYLTLSDNGTQFSCDDGLTSAFLSANVSVNDDLETLTNESRFDSSNNQTELKVTTGCLKENTANQMTIIWYYLKVNVSGSRERYRDDSAEKEAKTENDSYCLADPDCGTPGLTQISSVLNITEDDNGDNYTFEVVIDYGPGVGKNTTLSFNNQFKLQFPETETETESTVTYCCCCGLVIAYFMIWIILSQLSIYGYAQCSQFLEYKYMKLFILQHISTHVPLFGLIPAVYIHYTLHKRKVKMLLNKRTLVLLLIVCIPIIGLIPMFLLALNKRKTGCLHCWISAHFCIYLLPLEIVIALLCPVWHISQWYSVIIAFIALMLRWIPLTHLALCHKDNDVPTPLAVRFTMWCIPCVGGVFYFYWQCKRQQNIAVLTGSRVVPEDRNFGSNFFIADDTTKNNKTLTKRALPSITGEHLKLKGTGGPVAGQRKLPPINQAETCRRNLE